MSVSVNKIHDSHSLIDGAYSTIPVSSEKGKEEANDEAIEETAIIPGLPDDAAYIILNFAINGRASGKTFGAISRVNSIWRKAVDRFFLQPCWRRLEDKAQNLTLRGIVQRINAVDNVVNSALNPSSSEAEPSDQVPLSNADQSLELNYLSRFIHLTDALRKSGAPIPNKHAVLGFDHCAYEDMQQRLDSALETIWTCVPQLKIDFEGAPVPVNAQEVRGWLNDSANAEKIARTTRLDLSNRNLTVVPSEIGKFTQLTWLALNQNQLAGLPETIGNLTQLTLFYLSYNQLTGLPETIGNLTRLTVLSLSNNRLTSLPVPIGNLTQLKEFYLHVNPLIFILDNRFRDSSWGGLNCNHRKTTNKYLACSQYACNFSLAALCQAIHRGEDDGVLREAFGKLSEAMQQRIHQKWSDIPASAEAIADLFTDRARFTEAVIGVIQDQLEALPDNQRNAVWNLAKYVPDSNMKWVEIDPADNIIRLIDAMECMHQFYAFPENLRNQAWDLAKQSIDKDYATDNIIRLVDAMECVMPKQGES